MITALEKGLENISGGKTDWGAKGLGDGETRRRKDLIVTARKEKEGLENLLNAMATKSKLDNVVSSIQDKDALVGSAKPRSGRVLGKETSETRELDNEGVLQLQKQKIADQDISVDEIRKIIMRQKELGIAINNELEVQNEMMRMVEEDTDRQVNEKRNLARANNLTGFMTRLTLPRTEWERYLEHPFLIPCNIQLSLKLAKFLSASPKV